MLKQALVNINKAEKISLKAFFDQVEERLAELSHEELRRIVRELARQAPPSGRPAFLQQLQPPKGVPAVPAAAIHEAQLLTDINALLASVDAAMTHPPEEDDDISYTAQEEVGSETYVQFTRELEALFDRTEAAFDYGQFATARDAFSGLFTLLSREDGAGRHLSPPETVDLIAVRTRYLRAVCAAAPETARPERLLEAIRKIHSQLYLDRPVFLKDILEIAKAPFAGPEAFLEGLIRLLENNPDRDADRLLREATRLRYGLPGLEQLARSQGTRHPRAWIDWLDALSQTESPDAMLRAAQQALSELPPGLALRALAADHLYTAAMILSQPETALTARWEAFLAVPSIERLLDVWDAAEAYDVRQSWMVRAADWQHHREPTRIASPDADEVFLDTNKALFSSDPAMTRAGALLLAGNWRAARDMADAEEVLGWSAGDSTQSLVVPFLLVWLSGLPPSALPTHLNNLWQTALTHAVGWGSHAQQLGQRLGNALALTMTQLPVEDQEINDFLPWSMAIVQRRVNAIVSGLYRGAYQRAATLALAAAEMLRARGAEAEGKRLLDELARTHHRKRAFQQELTTCRGAQFY